MSRGNANAIDSSRLPPLPMNKRPCGQSKTQQPQRNNPMKRLLAILLGLLAGAPAIPPSFHYGEASAADQNLPVKAPIVTPAFSWSGAYIGVLGGMSASQNRYDFAGEANS